jgi:hypothetical protein
MAKKYELNVDITANDSLDKQVENLRLMVEYKEKLKGDLLSIPDADVKKISETTKELTNLIDATNEQKKVVKDSIETEKEAAKQKEKNKALTEAEIKAKLKDQAATNEQKKALKLLIAEEKAAEGSREKAVAVNARLRAERDKLNLSTKEGVNRLKEINTAIDVNNNFLTENNDKLGKQKDNIGNYKSALEGLPGAFGAAARGADGLGKQFLKLLTNPIVLIIAAITAALTGLFKAFTSSDEGGTKFAAVMEQVSAVIDVVRQRAVLLAGSLAKLLSGDFTGAAQDFAESFKGVTEQMRNATQAAKEYINALDEIEDAEIGFISERAKNAKKIAELEFSAADRKKSIKERKNALVEAINIAEEQLKVEADLLEKRYENELKYAADKNNIDKEVLRKFIESGIDEQKELLKNNKELRRVRNAINDEGQEALENSFAAQLNAYTKFYQENKRNQSKITAFEDQIRADKEKKDKEAAERRKKQLEDEANLEKQLIDARIRNIEDAKEKEIATELASFKVKLSVIKGNSATEIALREQLEIEKTNKLNAINKKYAEIQAKEAIDAIERQMKAERELVIVNKEIELLKVAETEIEGRKKIEEELLLLREDAIKVERDLLLNNAKLTADERYLIEAEAEKKILELKKKANKDIVNEAKKREEEIKQGLQLATQEAIEQSNMQFQAQQKIRDEGINSQQKNIEVQQQRAAQGLSNTLELEQRKLKELEIERDRAAKKEIRRQKTLSYFSLLQGYAKTDSKTALQNTIRDIAISEAATALFAEKGGVAGKVKDTTTVNGNSLSRSHGRGSDVLMVLDKQEGIITKSRMNKIGGEQGFNELMTAIDRGTFFNDIQTIPQFVPVADSKNDALVSEVRVLQSIIKNKKETSVNVDNYGNVIKREAENGYARTIKKIRERPRF